MIFKDNMFSSEWPAERRRVAFSDDEKYRYWLSIDWDLNKPRMGVIGLNPSTANEMIDDPTIRRCKAFAKREGCGGLMMLNLYAYRATKPKDMFKLPRGLWWGEDNTTSNMDVWLGGCSHVVAAWGAHARKTFTWPTYVIDSLEELGVKILTFGPERTANGMPRHPLYLRADTPLCNYISDAHKTQLP